MSSFWLPLFKLWLLASPMCCALSKPCGMQSLLGTHSPLMLRTPPIPPLKRGSSVTVSCLQTLWVRLTALGPAATRPLLGSLRLPPQSPSFLSPWSFLMYFHEHRESLQSCFCFPSIPHTATSTDDNCQALGCCLFCSRPKMDIPRALSLLPAATSYIPGERRGIILVPSSSREIISLQHEHPPVVGAVPRYGTVSEPGQEVGVGAPGAGGQTLALYLNLVLSLLVMCKLLNLFLPHL